MRKNPPSPLRDLPLAKPACLSGLACSDHKIALLLPDNRTFTGLLLD